MNIGIIGSGEMGLCLATKFARQGHTVSITNSRGPASLKQIADNIGAKNVTIKETIENQNVVVISIPTKSVPQLPTDLFSKLPEDVVVIDTMNYYPTLRDGAIPALDQHGIDSVWVQEQIGFPLVKIFNSILATSLNEFGKRKGESKRIALAVSGDRIKAKEIVFQLVEELGFDPFDVGAINQSWKQQPGSLIYCRDITLLELKKRADVMGSSWMDMRSRILAKRKADEALMKADYPAYLRSLQDGTSINIV